MTETSPPARLLDLSRLVSRVGHPADTGIDRVERAYLRRLVEPGPPLFGLVRTALGFVLLDRGGVLALRDRLDGVQPWGAADLPGRITRRDAPARGRAEADLRRLARARCLPSGLAGMLRRHLPPGTAYLNVGHSNLSQPVLAAIRSVPGARIAVMVHDVIPLDHPQFSRPDTPVKFARLLRAVGGMADLVIYNSADSAAAAETHLGGWGRVPPAIVAHLGVDTAGPDVRAIPAFLPLDRPFFVTLGTIEPRKNHALLLDLWEGFHSDLPVAGIPRLFILGARGWSNDAVFRRLDALPFRDDTLFEVAALPDAGVAALMQGAHGLLFPSLAEGFGLPPLEAACFGTPVVCADLPVYRETLGDYPVYVAGMDRYLWAKSVRDLARCRQRHSGAFCKPEWSDHFNRVLSRT
ncbi:MAG: glycosyltransferase family 4 protein [Rhodobacteraceae bacterium]|nr:glycosyltransferase family 4 protein [Paracoccaceae bacterium]